MVDRRVQITPKDNTPIGYRISAVYPSSGGLATAAVMSSMISGEVISGSGGGGEFLTPKEFDALRSDPTTRTAIRAYAAKPQPKIIQVVVSMTANAYHNEVLADLKRQGFALHKRGQLGSIAFFVGEIYDTYLEEAKLISGVDDIQLKEDVTL